MFLTFMTLTFLRHRVLTAFNYARALCILIVPERGKVLQTSGELNGTFTFKLPALLSCCRAML